jgi:hypothetical protein
LITALLWTSNNQSMEPRLSIAEYAKSRGIAPGRYSGVEAASIRKGYEAYSRAYDTKLAQSQAETSFTPTGTEVMFPDGTTRKAVKTSPNSAELLKDYTAPPPQYRETEDGRIGMIYPDGRTVYAWDANSGQPIKAAKKADPFAALLGGAPQPAAVGQSGAATLEPPVSAPNSQLPASSSQSAPAPAPAEPQVYSISGEEDYAKVPPGATVSWNGQTFIKR